MSASRASRIGPATGFTYLGVLFLIVFLGLGLAAIAHVWHVSIQRDKEAELLFIGGQFRNAIQRYSEISPGNASKQEFPKKLEDLLEDKRFGTFTMRHLRKIYVDPMTSKPDWDLVVLPGIGIVGVHSKSEGTPIKSSGFPAEFDKFSEAKNYTDWVFSPTSAPTTATPAGTTPVGSAVPPTGSPMSGMPTAGVGPITSAPGAGANPGTQPSAGSPPPDPRADAEAACQSTYTTRAKQCNSAADRGAAPGGLSCLDRAMQQLNECMSRL
jgi:type II secretory pathway pseudopilin PulG